MPILCRIQIEFWVRIVNLVRRLCHELLRARKINTIVIVALVARRTQLITAGRHFPHSKLIRLSMHTKRFHIFAREIGLRCRGEAGAFVASAALAGGQRKFRYF